MAIPAALKQLVDILQILIDMIMVGMVSVHALAAVGLSMQLMMVVHLFTTLYAVGGNALIARFIGAKRKKRASSLLYALVLFASFLALIISFAGYFGAASFYELMGSQAEVIQEGERYFSILACGFILIFLDTLFFNALSAAGDTKSSLYIKLLSAGLNAFLNYILIFGHFGFEAMGVAGAAYATLIAYAFNLAAYSLVLRNSHAKLGLIMLVRVKDLNRVIKVGWSAALDRGITSLSFLLFVSIIASYGTEVLAGYQVGLRIEGIAFMPGFGFAIAVMALVGQSLGAKEYERAYESGIATARLAYVFMGSVGVALVSIPEYFIGFFTTDDRTVEAASHYLILVGLAQIPLALSFIYSSALRGAGATALVLKVNVASLWLLRLIPSYIAFHLGYGVLIVFVIMNVETLIKGVVFYYLYRKKSWLLTKV